MLVSADVKCYLCGFVSGEAVLDTLRPNRVLSFRPRPDADLNAAVLRPGSPLRCARCAGAVFLDDLDTIRPRARSVESEIAQVQRRRSA